MTTRRHEHEADLRETWTAHLGQAPEWETGAFPGRPPRGWALDAGVPEILAPFAGPVPRRPTDLLHFGGLSGPAAADLLEALPESERECRHNFAPTTRACLIAAAEFPDEVGLHGFATGPARGVEAISIPTVVVRGPDGLRIFSPSWDDEETPHPDWCQCARLDVLVRDRYGLDHLHGPDEITPWRAPVDDLLDLGEEPTFWRLWWD
ncbi:hypothetical protein [Cellulomonas sp. PhB150]|uniref:hypothetical protein n=1 Tax=Cellulomonas sp. PhB150 TaxID=2485188 RepID=UPI0011CE0DA5|nr:hypothetical protein [Cellulomonas sp. PhB150]